MAQRKSMSRPRMTAVVRRGLQKMQRASQSNHQVVVDHDVSRALDWLDTTCNKWHEFAKSSPPGPRDEWAMTQSGWVKRPKKAKGKRRRRTPDVSFDVR